MGGPRYSKPAVRRVVACFIRRSFDAEEPASDGARCMRQVRGTLASAGEGGVRRGGEGAEAEGLPHGRDQGRKRHADERMLWGFTGRRSISRPNAADGSKSAST